MPKHVSKPFVHQAAAKFSGQIAASLALQDRVDDVEKNLTLVDQRAAGAGEIAREARNAANHAVRIADGAGGVAGNAGARADQALAAADDANARAGEALAAAGDAGARVETALAATERARGVALVQNVIDQLDSISRGWQGASAEKAQQESAHQRFYAYRQAQGRPVFVRANAFFEATEDQRLCAFWSDVTENDLPALDKPEAWHATGEAQDVVERLRDKLADLIFPDAEADEASEQG